ncbi:SRPBCC family protein [Nonomuraea sp. NPDC050547]|uniref:SRPBCC family protein n=1 Tax=unclassified Nonomuraea TaxID=2593643 RepID=UPI003789E86E
MASIRISAVVGAPAATVWAALRDVHDLPRLAPGFVVKSERDGERRVITFDNGAVATELIVDVDEADRRVAYAIVDSPLALVHHHAISQVVEAGEGRCTFAWQADFLPADREPVVRAFMERGLAALIRAHGKALD